MLGRSSRVKQSFFLPPTPPAVAQPEDLFSLFISPPTGPLPLELVIAPALPFFLSGFSVFAAQNSVCGRKKSLLFSPQSSLFFLFSLLCFSFIRPTNSRKPNGQNIFFFLSSFEPVVG